MRNNEAEEVAVTTIALGSDRMQSVIKSKPDANPGPMARDDGVLNRCNVPENTSVKGVEDTDKKDIEPNPDSEDPSTAQSPKSVAVEQIENGLNSEITTQRDSGTLAESCASENLSASLSKTPDRSCELTNTPNPVNPGHDENPLPTTNPEETIITIANDEAMVRAKSNSVIVVNISTGHTQRRNSDSNRSTINNVAEIIRPPTDSAFPTETPLQIAESEIPLPSGRNTAAESPPSGRMSIAECLQVGPVAPLPQSAHTLVTESSQTTADAPSSETSYAAADESLPKPLSNQSSRTCIGSTASIRSNQQQEAKEKIDSLESGKSSDSIASRRSSFGRKNEVLDETEKLKCGQTSPEQNPEQQTSPKQMAGDDVSKNLEPTAPSAPRCESMQLQDSKNVSGNSEFRRENSNVKRSSSPRSSVASGRKHWDDDVSEVEERPATYTISGSSMKSSLPTATRKTVGDRKRVTLASPFVTSTTGPVDVDTNMKLDLKQQRPEISSQRQSPEAEEVKSTKQQTATTTTTTTTSTTNTTSAAKDSNSVRIKTGKMASKRQKVTNLWEKYQLVNEASFEADFTPRRDRTIRVKAHRRGVDVDLDLHIRRLPSQGSYDPDFTEYDFM